MQKKKISKKQILLLSLLLFSLVIHLFSYNASWVEKYYSNGIYFYTSRLFRMFFGWFPFSVGDLFYFFIVSLILWIVFKKIKNKIKSKKNPNQIRKKIDWISLFIYLTITYIFFNLLWGLNYNRIGLAKQIGLELKKYDIEELRQLNSYLVQKVNISKMMLSDRNILAYKTEETNKTVISAYHKASLKYPFLNYSHLSVKPSLWSGLMSYAGINGYYNPITAEAQINKNFPAFLLPYVSSHEVAHQLGYAKEMEANFVGYLVAITAGDNEMKYSAYLDMFLYANNDLRKTNSEIADYYRDQLSPEVKNDLEELRKFYKNHESFLDSFISFVYDKFLFLNRQKKGIKSYNEVVKYLIAFYKKNGSL